MPDPGRKPVLKKDALADVKVADFSWVGVGPMTTKYLADHGATVVRIESAVRPDPLRLSSPFKDDKPGLNRSGYYAFYNANKYSISLNLNDSHGLQLAQRLVKWADIVAESFTSGQMELWGLGFEDLQKINPDIIMIRMSMQGQTGPYAKHLGFGYQLAGLAGLVNATGWEDQDPVQPYGAYSDWATPRLTTAVLLAALEYRDRTGTGQCLDFSQFEGIIQLQAPYLLEYTATGRVAGRRGNASPCAAPHGVFPCQGDDRWCAIGIFSEEQWQNLVRIMGNPGWAHEPAFATLADRKANEARLNELMGKWTTNFVAEDLMVLLQKNNIPAGRVANARDVCEDPQLKFREQLWRRPHPELGNFLYQAPAFRLSKTPARWRKPAPGIGENNYEVCTQILGMSDEEFVALNETNALK